MKKFFAGILSILILMALMASAFAAPSVSAPLKDAKATSALPFILWAADANGDPAIEVVNENRQTVRYYPIDALILYSAGEAKATLLGEEESAFEEAYQSAVNEKDKLVPTFVWLDLKPRYKEDLKETEGIKLRFNIPSVEVGDTVEVFINGKQNPTENVVVNEDGSVSVCFYKFGAVAFMKAK